MTAGGVVAGLVLTVPGRSRRWVEVVAVVACCVTIASGAYPFCTA